MICRKGGDSKLSAQVLSPGVFDLSKKLSINKVGRDQSAKKPEGTAKSPRQLTAIPTSASALRSEEKGEEKRRETPSGKKVIRFDEKAEIRSDGEVIDLAGDEDAETVPSKPKSSHCPRMSEQMVAEGYKLHPPMSKLKEMDDVELSQVEGFEVSRTGYGSVSRTAKNVR